MSVKRRFDIAWNLWTRTRFTVVVAVTHEFLHQHAVLRVASVCGGKVSLSV